jgi:carbon-monoxide dehydrogenase catalytic subunit
MSGQDATIALKLNNSNDPNMHSDLHEKVKVNYQNIEKSPESMEEVHKWQRKHVAKGDQAKEGYPMNIIIDTAMREMYQVVHNSSMTEHGTFKR